MDFPKYRTPKTVTYGKASRRKVQGTGYVDSRSKERSGISDIQVDVKGSTLDEDEARPTSNGSSPANPVWNLSKLDRAVSSNQKTPAGPEEDDKSDKSDASATSEEILSTKLRLEGWEKDCAHGASNVYEFEDDSRNTKRRKISPVKPSVVPVYRNQRRGAEEQRSLRRETSPAARHSSKPSSSRGPSEDRPNILGSRREVRIEIPRRQPAGRLTQKPKASHDAMSARKSPQRQVSRSREQAEEPFVAAPSTPPPAASSILKKAPRAYASVNTKKPNDKPPNTSSITPHVQGLPPTERPKSPESSVAGACSPARTTPRQAKLWGQLLESSADGRSATNTKRSVSQKLQKSSSLLDADVDTPEDLGDGGRFTPDRLRKRLIDVLTPQGSFDESTIRHTDESDSENEEKDSRTGTRSSQSQTGSPEARPYQDMNGSEVADSKLGGKADDKLSQTSVLLQYGGPRTTYSQQRSHLVEDDPLQEQLLGSDTPFSIGAPRNLKRQLPKYGFRESGSQRNSSQREPETGSRSGPIRSIHELREAGINRRFADEMGTLFEDLEDSSPSSTTRKLEGLHTLLSKFSNRDFAQRLIDQDFDRRLLACLEGEYQGIISRSLLSMAVFFLLRASKSPRTLRQAQGTKILQSIASLLDLRDDIRIVAESEKMSRSALQELSDVRDDLERSILWNAEVAITPSPRMISLRCLDAIMRGGREAGCNECGLSRQVTLELISILVNNAQALSAVSVSVSKQQVIELEQILSIFESFSLYANSSLRESTSDHQVTSSLATCLSILLKYDDSDNIPIMSLRFLLNITNNDAEFCNALSHRSLIENLVHLVHSRLMALSSSSMLDTLVLALGVLINFAELSDQARYFMVVAQLNNDRWLDASVQQFLARRDSIAEADSMEATHFNVVFGYLAVLLGNMCHNDAAAASIRALMPKGSLQPILDAVNEFLIYHKKVDTEMFGTENTPAEEMNFTAHLQQVADYLEAIM
ncbi:hypothetical protein L228DRAFT_247035 [Xylona heveae TC161]|uniref:Wings apart-like protein C-terminal domain-containing protein n=1 Tax=Xylona heveae (strain CBS 132557 / TC161) TaxID=1328760 RepID=A0A165GW83_XYLHT|nr:hypothetical protein L228DRAFT_247035 [Xylona heveae TC161]KZF22675.1 hypothetical protein L228DRAFT_247035 [Xylona heveae TC161]